MNMFGRSEFWYYLPDLLLQQTRTNVYGDHQLVT